MIERSKIATIVAELFGSAVLTYSVLAVTHSGLGISYFIASTVALAFGLMVMALGGSVMGYFNPVVTLGLWTLRKLRTIDSILYIAAQFLGAVAASALFVYLTNQKLQSIAEKSFNWRITVAEGAGALVVGFGVAAAVYRGYEGIRLAATIAGALFLGVMIAGAGSNGLVNPAVAVGVQSWSKGYVIGPIVGAVVGMNLYSLLFAPVASVAGMAVGMPVRTRSASVSAPAKKKTVAKKKPAARRKK